MIAAGIVLGLTVFTAAPQAGSKPVSAREDLIVEASLSTAGPYGEMWTLHLAPGGNVFVRVYYTATPSGTVMADFNLSEEQLKRFRAIVEAERFFELPAEITPRSTPLHMPDFRLEISLGPKKHKVQLYDPAQMKGDANAKRFLAVWAGLYASLPLKPPS
jgi:hypothetical protein